MAAPMLPHAGSHVARAVTDALRAKRELEGDRPTADGTRGRGSMARACSRRLAFDAAKVERTVPDSDFNLITWQIGQDAHDRIQAGLKKHFGARLEVPVSYRPDRDFSGNVDFVVDEHPITGESDDDLVTGEIKSMRQFGFDIATGARDKRDQAPGPKIEHVTQAAMYGLAPQLESRYLWIVYWAKDTGSMAEWIFDVDEPLVHLDGAPTARKLATDELDRMEAVFEVIDGGEIPKAVIPGVGPIHVPDPDDHWQCRFCPHQPTCDEIGPDRVPVDLAADVAVSINAPAQSTRTVPDAGIALEELI